MIYLDSSALLKLLHEEPESAALADRLSARTAVPVVSSELAKVEVPRACRRVNAEALPEARNLLAELDLIPLTSDVIDEAADVGEVLLRGLDAIHLASALRSARTSQPSSRTTTGLAKQPQPPGSSSSRPAVAIRARWHPIVIDLVRSL